MKPERWQELSPLLDRALELSTGDRAAFLAELRGDSPELAADLERLLGAGEEPNAGEFLAGAAPLAAPPTLAGQAIGPYTLEQQIGAGGMGSVWRARRSDGRFEAEVAVKLLHAALLERETEARFRHEGTIAARLSHPNIARLLDAGVSAIGQPYLVLELVDGEPIDRYADAHGLDVEARLRLFLSVLDAVAHAHANLVVHRDIKPSNVFVSTAGEVKLLDFGIAKFLADDGPALTRDAGRIFTPEFAAPEQVTGEPVTTATDVYSLGALLYLLLVGRNPNARPRATASSPSDLLKSIVERDPRPLSAAVAEERRVTPATAGATAARRSTTPVRLQRRLEGDLDLIVAKALKKAPGERYPTVAAFADDLTRHLHDLPVRARRDSLGYRLRKLVARRRLEVATAAIVVVALVAATAIAWRQARASAAERDRALEELHRAEITNDLSGFLISEANPEGQPLSKTDLLSRAEALIEARFADSPALQAHMLVLLSSRYYEISDYPRWRRVLKRAHELSARTTDRRLRAVAACELAMATTDEDPARAQELLAEANVELGGVDAAAAAAELARCRLDEAIVASWGGQFERAIAAAEESLRYEAARPGPAGRGAEALNTLGLAQGQLGRFEAANATFERLFAVLAAERRSRTRLATTARHNWALALVNAGQVRRALVESETVVAVTRELGGGPVSPYKLSALASLLSYAGRHEEAIATVEEAIRNASGTLGSQVPFWTYCVAARVRAEAGQVDEAKRALAEMDRAFEAIPSPPAGLAGMRELYRARATVEFEPVAAVASARRALELLEGEKQPARDLLQALLIAARAQNDLGDAGAAADDAARALALARDGLGGFTHSRELGLAELEAARAAARKGELPAARSGFERALENLRDAVGAGTPETRRAERLAAAPATG
jgi:serine/threonine-protein kinase